MEILTTGGCLHSNLPSIPHTKHDMFANIKYSSTSGVVILEFKPSLSESDTDVFVYYCLNHAYIFYYWNSTRGIKVGYKTAVHTQVSDILGSPFRVIKVPERWMREEKECKARPSVE